MFYFFSFGVILYSIKEKGYKIFMKCNRCKKENLRKANFCQSCGKKFTDKEKEEAMKSTTIGTIKYYEEWIDEHTIVKYLKHPLTKVIYILGILAIGFYNIYEMGTELKIMNGDNYEVSYNTEADEYYIVTDEPPKDGKVYLSMYIPNKVETMTVDYYNPDGVLLETENKTNHEGIVLNINTLANNYYTIKDDQKDSKKLKVFIYYGGA